ncbi:MAG: peptide chain release factor N(5)-glutamine methyltransferase [Bacillota bacterium]|nr:peptide chain release factor N(5)-glutamine methyltransferase [Bacillota bacterium]MDW7684360.1 peptide chain release factor N(5)-glutamine methyltransferase [Bacillota bacterium]
MSIEIKEALRRASFCLRRAGFDQPRREAEALMVSCLGVSLAWIYAHDDEKPPQETLTRFFALVDRRIAGEPYAYLAGEKEFMGLPFTVTPDVLIPRPETELLVEEARRALGKSKKPRILDVGVGSGAVAVTLAVLLPEAVVTAVDISGKALAVAAKNAAHHGVADRVRLFAGDLYRPVAGEAFDAVISNPPYIPTAEIAGLQREVRGHEPHLALDGGADGLDIYRRLTAELTVLASPPPLLAFEVGYNQADVVAELCRSAGYKKNRQINDLAGIARVVLAELL